MSENASLARPYVRAVFEIARADDDLAAWSDQLALLAAVAGDPQVRALDGHPRMSRDALADLVLGVCGDALVGKARSLVKLLAHNRRLSLSGEIASQYEVLRAQAENVVEAELESAIELDDAQRKSITDALQARLGRSVKLTCSTNTDLLGGAVIRTGDWVFDGSVRAQLQKMAAALNA
jgi:F-type H+-transporting ATPase subunit delta